MSTRTCSSAILAAAAVLIAVPAQAQSATDSRQFSVSGNVPSMCVAGTVTGGNATFDLGVLVDTSTGLLRNNLAVPSKTITGSYCSARSTISVVATPIEAQAFTTTPPAGFSRTVNYTATASGWTSTAASFTTGAASNAAASQVRDTPFSGDIAVALGNFATGGGNGLRLVADTAYSGNVTVTLAVAS